MCKKFMIKYGEEEHLKQIIKGKLRFTPSQKYIEIEETQHNKGQGDLLEGKMKVKFKTLQLYDPDTNMLAANMENVTVTISIQDVNNIPIFCLSHYDEKYIKELDGKRNIILKEKELENVQKDLPKATHALIILEPEKFIQDVHKSLDNKVVDDEIRYYNYDENPLEMYTFLATGNTKRIQSGVQYMEYKNRYRHLLCKDIDFENQREYRFIALDEMITSPKFYDFEFTSKYMLVPIDELKKELVIE